MFHCRRCCSDTQAADICFTRPWVQRHWVYFRIKNGIESCAVERKKLWVIWWHVSATAADVDSPPGLQSYVPDTSATGNERIGLFCEFAEYVHALDVAPVRCAEAALALSKTMFDFLQKQRTATGAAFASSFDSSICFLDRPGVEIISVIS